jgi:hypothetical protein
MEEEAAELPVLGLLVVKGPRHRGEEHTPFTSDLRIRFGQRHGLQNTILTFYFYKNIYKK